MNARYGQALAARVFPSTSRGELPAGGGDVTPACEPHRRRDPGSIEHMLESGDRVA